jgi:hypothetical protein
MMNFKDEKRTTCVAYFKILSQDLPVGTVVKNGFTVADPGLQL